MDKTFNDLMSIVNRTRKIDESEGRTTKKVVRKVETPREEVEIVEKKENGSKKSGSLFDGAKAINKLISSPKKTTKAKTSAKKAPAKTATAKKTATKKTTDKKPAKDTAEKINSLVNNAKKTPAKKEDVPATTNFDMSDPKNAQLYAALHSSLFSQGTDISQYMDMDNSSEEKQAQLAELKKQREAMKISQEISREQQEYEKLFTGSLGFMGEEEVQQEEETVQPQNNNNLTKDRLQSIQNLPRPTATPRPEQKPQQKSKDIDKKIADYYRRKQEMIEKFNKEQYAGIEQDDIQEDNYEKRQSEYEDIFNNSVYNNQTSTEQVEENPEDANIAEKEENLENLEEYENAELLNTEEQEERPEMVFEDYDDEEEIVRKLPSFRFPTNNEFEDIDNEYSLIKRGVQDDRMIHYQEDDLNIVTSTQTTEEVEDTAKDIVNEENAHQESEVVENNSIQEENEIIENTVDESVSSENANEDYIEENTDETQEIATEEENVNEFVSDDISNSSSENSYEDEEENLEQTQLENEQVEQTENNFVDDEIIKDNENITSEQFESENIEETEEKTDEENNAYINSDNSERTTDETVEENAEIVENTNQNEFENAIVSEYGEEETTSKYDLRNGDIHEYVITSNMPDEEKITSENSVFAQDVVYEEDNIENQQTEDVEGDSEDNLDIIESEEDIVEENDDNITQDIYEEEPQNINDDEDTNNSQENIDITEDGEKEEFKYIEDTESQENIDDYEEITETDEEIEDDEETSFGDDEEIDEYIEESAEENEVVITTEDVNDELYDAHLSDIEGEDNGEIINAPLYDDDDDDNTMVIDGDKFVSELSLYHEEEKEEEESPEELPQEEKEESDTISKEEFYNEMARLQENLINELKGKKSDTPSVDFFQEDDLKESKEADDFDEYITFDNTNGEELPTKELDEENASKLAEEIINNWKEREGILDEPKDGEDNTETEEVQEEKVNEDAIIIASEIENGMNLLQLEKPLDDEDLKYQEESEKEKEVVKDGYFYLSAEDNEKKYVPDDDEYVKMYNEEITGIYEVGDINLNKDIMNAVPYAKVDDEEEKRMKKEKEIELIYTLFGMEKKNVAKEKEDMKVLYVAGECQPFIATGGLADVAGSLPKAIAKKGGVDIRVILPLYGAIKDKFIDKFEYIGNFTVHLSWRQEYCGLFRYYSDGVTYYFIDNERYFKREKTYGYYDDGERFAYFSKAIVECLPHINFFPDIIHCNDWQTALVSTYIKTGNWSDFRYYKIKNIYTIHNVEYQGVYGMENLKDLFGIDHRFRTDMDYNGDINLTKAAIQFSDKFTTVSNSYCDNLKQPYCSRGLHHVIIRNDYKLCGIVNGLDYEFYDPETDKIIYKNYNINSIQDKVMNKKIWQEELGLPVDGDTPMLSIVSRLVSHKGFDLIIKMIEKILAKDVQLVVVGTGDQKYVDYFKYLEGKYPTKVRAMVDKFSNELARKAYAASDIFIMPSKVEPCGLSQMVASRYGSVPIVREVGGLKDTITDFGCEGGGNGYTFTNYNPDDLEYQISRALVDYTDKQGWKKKIEICMSQNFTWEKSADKYIELYNSVIK